MPMQAAQLKMLRSARTLGVPLLRYVFIYMLTLGIALPPSWTIPTVTGTETAYANSYPIAYSKYEKGDFKGAESALKKSLKKKLSKADQAKAYKLLGICSYMLGNKPAATNSFKRALKLEPKTSIAQSEVLDDSVIAFFTGIKGGGKKASPPAKVATKAALPKPVTTAKKSPPAKMTYLKILSNVASASIAVDGILAGQVNTLINTDAGKIAIEVSAQGYITKKVSVNISANRENTITVNLLKPQPKPKPKPKPKPIVRQKPQQRYDQQLTTKKKKKKKKSNKYAPDPGGEMFVNERGGAPGDPDTATQFEMDTGRGYPPAQPGYGAQPGYAQPGYAQPPGYGPQPGYGPPPGYYAPPPPIYYAPPPQPIYVPPPPPPADPYAGAGYADPNAPPAMAADPAAPPGAGGGGGSQGSTGNNLFYTLLPFGAGQFQNKSYILGTAFLGAEAYALYFWYSEGQKANAVAAEANKHFVENCSAAASNEDRCDEPYLKESRDYVTETNKKAQMGLYGFIGLWVVGVAEAIINEPTPQPRGGRQKKTGRYAGIQYSPTPDGHHFSLVGHQYDNKLFAYDVGVDITPIYSFESDKIKNQLSLSLNLSF